MTKVRVAIVYVAILVVAMFSQVLSASSETESKTTSELLQSVVTNLDNVITTLDQLTVDCAQSKEVKQTALDTFESMRESLKSVGCTEDEVEACWQNIQSKLGVDMPEPEHVQAVKEMVLNLRNKVRTLLTEVLLAEVGLKQVGVMPKSEPKQEDANVTPTSSFMLVSNQAQAAQGNVSNVPARAEAGTTVEVATQPSVCGFLKWLFTGHIKGINDRPVQYNSVSDYQRDKCDSSRGVQKAVSDYRAWRVWTMVFATICVGFFATYNRSAHFYKKYVVPDHSISKKDRDMWECSISIWWTLSWVFLALTAAFLMCALQGYYDVLYG